MRGVEKMPKENRWFFLALILVTVFTVGVITSCVEKSPEPPPPPPPAPVPAAPNDSIVTAEVIAIQSQNHNMPLEIIIEIQSSQDVPGYLNATKQKIGQQMAVRTNEDASRLIVGQVITAHVRLEGDERTRYYYAWDIQ